MRFTKRLIQTSQSLAVIIPKSILKFLGLQKGDMVEIQITKVKEK